MVWVSSIQKYLFWCNEWYLFKNHQKCHLGRLKQIFCKHPQTLGFLAHFKTEKKRKYIFPLFIMVGPEGLEPPTRPLWAASSNQLSYRPTHETVYIVSKKNEKSSFFYKIAQTNLKYQSVCILISALMEVLQYLI